jgi:hypothetical protein
VANPWQGKPWQPWQGKTKIRAIDKSKSKLLENIAIGIRLNGATDQIQQLA